MSIRNIMWTALPNGFTAAGDALKLSVLISPRLVTNAPTGTLAEFPDFLDWPSTVGALRFNVEFQGGPSVTVSPVVEPSFPALDSPAWGALFDKRTAVTSYAYENKVGLNVLSFPVKKVFSFLKAQYRNIAVTSPGSKPSLTQLGIGPNTPGDTGFGQVVIDQRQKEHLDAELSALLKEGHAVPAEAGSPALDFYQVQIVHQFLSKRVPKPDGTLEPLPPQKPTELDFHRAIASLGQYQKLMRALGIVIDLEIPVAKVPSASTVRVTPNLDGVAPMTPWTAYQMNASGKQFFAAPGVASDVTTGMLLLSGTDQYEVVEADVDGAAEKVLDFASNLRRIAFGEAKSTIDTPQNYGVPSLRSAGFSCARTGRAQRLVATFRSATQNNTNIVANPQSPAVVLVADDVTRGYRVDVWTSLTGQWHSLCFRDGEYNFLNGLLTRQFSDEGFVTVATSQSADGSSPDLRLPESLFRWAGWSLCARRPGRTIGSDSTPASPANPATTAFKLETNFTVTKGTLPRLRFGALYQFRARAADLAANSIPHDTVLDDIFNLPPQPMPYLRYEPVPPPVLVLREALGPDTTPGESVERMVIRSNFDTHIAAISERHMAPPKATHEMVELHGMLDTAAGPPDKAQYALLANRDGSFNIDPAHPDQPVPHPEAELALPYLPDPFAPGAAFRTLPGTPANSVWKIPFSGPWPDPRPFRLALDEGSAPPTLVETPTERVLTVHLPKAEMVTVAMSCFLSDDDATQPPRMLSTMKIWAWITEANPANLADLKQLALNGGHWMLTPPRALTLVHAVQQPLIEPQFQNLTSTRSLGETFATISDEFPISGKSTIKVDMQADWQEPVDDLSDNPQPVLLNGSTTAFSTAIESSIAFAQIQNKHEFHDTKHRKVNYTAVATTRFREYFPAAVTADADNLTRKSLPQAMSILNSARPAAPKVLYVLPTFAWHAKVEDAWNFSRRGGGGLRIYLDRPWFSSGEGELLGAVLWGCPPPQHQVFAPFEVPETLRSYVTQWGMDPIWNAPALPSEAVPREEHFRNAAAFGHGLSLDEMVRFPNLSFSVAGHEVLYDNTRKLWYCDIEMDSGDAYFPFVRLALAAYQPESISDAHLSRVVLADFIQLLPDRSASITFDPIETTSLEVAVTGKTYQGPGAVSMTALLETQPAGGGEQAWVPVALISLTPNVGFGPATLWTAQIKLPAARGARPFRLVIEEFETFTRDSSGARQKRLVYADILNL
ncbi:MAG TPA: hypothetical protein VNX66_17690 [Candidatus Sulfotelmatobacter sp.]|jgi:hypothetical protein|nr:hypothetical protein [Candidatus Sulfotelmatobacter sp.]